MKSAEEQLVWRNKIAGTLGIQQVREVLEEYLETARRELSSTIPTDKDPAAYNVHRALGRVEMLEYLIAQGKLATKTTENKGSEK
jgi:hypothetical protein